MTVMKRMMRTRRVKKMVTVTRNTRDCIDSLSFILLSLSDSTASPCIWS
jgi:hypothetical protein